MPEALRQFTPSADCYLQDTPEKQYRRCCALAMWLTNFVRLIGLPDHNKC